MGSNRKERFLRKHELENKDEFKGVNDLFPKFSFEFCFNGKRALDKVQGPIKQVIMDKITMLSQLTWGEIKDLNRERGFEKIDKNQFTALQNIPQKFKEEKKITVFRLNRDKGRLIGYIEAETFFVVWIDTEFNMYKH